MGQENIPLVLRLETFEHWCMNPDNCAEKIVERAKVGSAGKVRKVVLVSPDGRWSKFMANVDYAIEWAEKRGATITPEDIAKCREAMK